MDTTRPKIHQFAYCRRRLLALTYKSLVSAALHAVNNQPAGQLASWELKEKPGGKVGTWPPIIYQKYYQSVNRWNGLMNVQQGGGMVRWQAYRSTKDRVSPLTGLLYMYVYGWGYDIGRGSGTQTDACIWLISENEEKSCRKRQDKVRQPSNGQNRNWITAGGPSFGQNERMCLCVRGKSTYLFLLLDVGHSTHALCVAMNWICGCLLTWPKIECRACWNGNWGKKTQIDERGENTSEYDCHTPWLIFSHTQFSRNTCWLVAFALVAKATEIP